MLRFLARNRMLNWRYGRLAWRYAWRRGLTRAGRRWRTHGFVFFGRGLEIEIGERGWVDFGRFVWIGDRTKVRCHEGLVEIGEKSVLGQECTITAYQHIRIGEQCVIAEDSEFRAVLAPDPRAAGHTIVVWKPHVHDFTELDDVATARLFVACRDVARAIRAAIAPTGLACESTFHSTRSAGCSGDQVSRDTTSQAGRDARSRSAKSVSRSTRATMGVMFIPPW